jgi:lysophospholipase
MGLMKESAEAVASGTGGWMDAVMYMAGLSGGSWGTGSWIANGGMLPIDMVDQVCIYDKEINDSYGNLSRI